MLGADDLSVNDVAHGDEVLGVVEFASGAFHCGVDGADLASLGGLHLHDDGRDGPVGVLAFDGNAEAGDHEGLAANEGDLRGALKHGAGAFQACSHEGGRIIDGEAHNDVVSALNNGD